jgi:hypothetical protein
MDTDKSTVAARETHIISIANYTTFWELAKKVALA